MSKFLFANVALALAAVAAPLHVAAQSRTD